MGDDNSRSFDLPSLLRSDDLDIRRVVKNNSSLQAEEYYKLLLKFTDYAPQATDTLSRIAALEGDENDFRSLAHIKIMLKEIGCRKLVPVVDDIINAGKRGHNQFAADSAKKFSGELNELCTYIMAAERTGKPETITGVLGEDGEDDPAEENLSASSGTQSLKVLLSLLDFEEATRKLRILAVDDAPVMLKTISTVLGSEYKVYGMTNPALLEKFLRQITPELFLLDYKMPEISGFDLVPIIRSFAEHKNTPIIFLTSMGTPDHVSAALTLGAVDFIVKPFQGNILREKVAKHIVRKKLF